jgi:hypothetical protein
MFHKGFLVSGFWFFSFGSSVLMPETRSAGLHLITRTRDQKPETVKNFLLKRIVFTFNR